MELRLSFCSLGKALCGLSGRPRSRRSQIASLSVPAVRSWLGLFLVVALAFSGCLPGPEVLRERYNAELLVLGIEPGQTLEVVVGARVLRPATPRRGRELTVLLSLPAGEHDGLVRVLSRQGDERCADFQLRVEEDDQRDATSVDVRRAGVCGADEPPRPSDAGPDVPQPPDAVFSSIAETITPPSGCGPQECTDVFTVDADGDVFVAEAGVERSGDAPLASLEALAVAVMSEEADALFRDGCQNLSEGPQVVLTRERSVPIAPLPEILVDEVDVSGCDDPAATAIRAAMAALRSAVFGG